MASQNTALFNKKTYISKDKDDIQSTTLTIFADDTLTFMEGGRSWKRTRLVKASLVRGVSQPNSANRPLRTTDIHIHIQYWTLAHGPRPRPRHAHDHDRIPACRSPWLLHFVCVRRCPAEWPVPPTTTTITTVDRSSGSKTREGKGRVRVAATYLPTCTTIMGGLCEGNAAAAAEKELRRGREREREKEKERKVKIMCSYGGSMVARPSDGALRYVGGDTRLCTVRHDVSLAQLLAKAAQLHMCGGGGVAGAGTALKLKLKYQAPAQRLDSLVSLTCDGDVRAMMRLYDRFLGSTAPAAAAAAVPQPQPQLQLLRLFLFQEAAAVAVAAAVPVVAHHPAASSNFQLQRPHDDFYAYPPQLHMNSHLHYHHHHHQQQQQQQQQQGMHLMDHSAAAFLAPSSAPLYFQGYSHAHGEFYQEPLVFQQQHLVKDPAPPPVHGTPVPANRAYHEVSRLNSDVAQGSVPFHVVATEGSELGIPAPASAPAYSHSLMELWSFSSEGFISPGVGLVEPFSAYPPSHTFEHQFVACTYAQQQQADVQGTEAVFETARSQGIAFGPQGAALLLERQSKGMAVDDSKLHDSNHPLSSKTRTDDFPLAYGSSSSDISSAAFAARDPQPFICLESEHDSGKSDRFIEEYGRHFAADISDKLRTQLDMRDLSHVGRFLDSASPVQLNRQVSENSALEFGLSEIDFLNSEVESTEFPLKKSTDVPECAESLLPTDDLLQCEESSHRDLKFPATPVPNNNLKEGISVKDNVKNTVIMGAAVQQLNDPLMRICTQRNRFENNLFHIPQDLMSVKVTEDEDSIFEEPTTEELETDSSTNKNEEDFPSDLQKIRNADLEDLREIGSGTFGTVYYGKWRGSDVAIKRINNSCFIGKPAEQKQMRADFLKEARTLAQLHHPNVVAFYGIVPDGPGGTFATVTEFMVNGSLRKVLQLQKEKSRTLDHRRRLIIALDAAFGMEYLHGKNIVHFDLKCENLLVNIRDPHRPICKVGDLGLSKIKHQTLVSAGLQGTLPWMAPELLNGRSRVSEKVDVFSFGIVMWELLTCEEPYANMHAGAILGGIVNNTLRPPIPKGCDPLWRMLMERCWSDDPSRRPNFTEIIDELRAMVALLPSKAQNQQALKQN